MKNRQHSEQFIENQDFSQHPIKEKEYELYTFRGCNFSNSDLTGLRFCETEFIDCNLSNANLAQVSFQDVNFVNCKMVGLHFDQCNAFGFSASFKDCRLNDSVFYQMKLGRTSFLGCSLHGVDFTEADLKNVLLKKCDLLNATFENTNLEKADFSESVNYSFHPGLNKIRGAKFNSPDVLRLLDVYGIKID